jgi:hypothetical protein
MVMLFVQRGEAVSFAVAFPGRGRSRGGAARPAGAPAHSLRGTGLEAPTPRVQAHHFAHPSTLQPKPQSSKSFNGKL